MLHGLVDRENFGINPDIGNVLWTYDVPEEDFDKAIDALSPVSKYWHCKNLHTVYHAENNRSVFIRVPLPDGEIGIIEQRGDNVFLGYWEMAEKTAESFREDGFFITGDMAVRDADGYISIVGRDKDLIISGGLNVYPKEVEGMIDDIEGVLESAVIGVPHRDFGEAVVAVVVRDDQGLEAATVETALAGQLAKFKQPKAVLFTDALPRNSMGKVQKAELRKTHTDLFA